MKPAIECSDGKFMKNFESAKEYELTLVANKIGEVVNTELTGKKLGNVTETKGLVVDMMTANPEVFTSLLKQYAEISELTSEKLFSQNTESKPEVLVEES